MDRDQSYTWRMVRYYLRVVVILLADWVLTVCYLRRYRLYVEQLATREISFVGIEKRARRGSPRKLVMSLCGKSCELPPPRPVAAGAKRVATRVRESAPDTHIARA